MGLTGYNRSNASWLIRNYGRKVVVVSSEGERVVFIGEIRKIRRRRARVHYEPKTSYQRLLESNYLGQKEKANLKKMYNELNVVKLKQEIERLREKLWRMQKYKKNYSNFRVDS